MNEHLKETEDFFDKIAPIWDETFAGNSLNLKAVMALSGLRENDKVIDIACGTGVLFDDILALNPSCLWGIDLSDRMLIKASEKYSDERIKLWKGDFYDFPEKDFDLAFIYRAYPHFPDKSTFAEKLHSVLKPNGRFIIAHNESRDKINRRHAQGAAEISDLLLPAETESGNFKDLFSIDIVADTDYVYIISGTRK
ncbi:class I SAM-dependent methyltransferase [Bacteroides nordii]|uniref:class I SAM-dependent methyltransferase n=1 Tax=Bacteroides nordii TaxID=291645 RepID=UPI00241D7E0E|nr:class I SAM-dependent methyltransferase [Bacteroides nordii]MBD9111534.1 class I SAM-dependent methyltransferase [Bacteroides nordii]